MSEHLFSFSDAILRRPGPDYASGITTAGLHAPTIHEMLKQHHSYAEALSTAGLELTILDSLPGYPDSYFVEDVAVITRDTAIITRPGAGARRGEIGAIQGALKHFLPLEFIRAPGTLDGGDVLQVGGKAWIGVSSRTNRVGAEQLAVILQNQGHQVTLVPVADGLHLKSDVNGVTEDTLLVTPRFAHRDEFSTMRCITIPEGEDYAANALRINNSLLIAAGYPRTRELLDPLDVQILEVDVSAARAMDGGLTCMSLRIPG